MLSILVKGVREKKSEHQTLVKAENTDGPAEAGFHDEMVLNFF